VIRRTPAKRGKGGRDREGRGDKGKRRRRRAEEKAKGGEIV